MYDKLICTAASCRSSCIQGTSVLHKIYKHACFNFLEYLASETVMIKAIIAHSSTDDAPCAVQSPGHPLESPSVVYAMTFPCLPAMQAHKQ